MIEYQLPINYVNDFLIQLVRSRITSIKAQLYEIVRGKIFALNSLS